MPEQSISTLRKARLPGLDADATPVIGVGLGLTGIMLGVRPRLAPVSLALTAAAVLLYRDPDRATPDEAEMILPASWIGQHSSRASTPTFRQEGPGGAARQALE